MDMFKMIKEANAMRAKLSQMDKDLKAKVLDVETKYIKIKLNAKQEFLEIKIAPELLKEPVEKVEKEVLNSVKDALKKSQDSMADEAKKITGGMNIPGLM